MFLNHLRDVNLFVDVPDDGSPLGCDHIMKTFSLAASRSIAMTLIVELRENWITAPKRSAMMSALGVGAGSSEAEGDRGGLGPGQGGQRGSPRERMRSWGQLSPGASSKPTSPPSHTSPTTPNARSKQTWGAGDGNGAPPSSPSTHSPSNSLSGLHALPPPSLSLPQHRQPHSGSPVPPSSIPSSSGLSPDPRRAHGQPSSRIQRMSVKHLQWTLEVLGHAFYLPIQDAQVGLL
jgi:hypothetical protein